VVRRGLVVLLAALAVVGMTTAGGAQPGNLPVSLAEAWTTGDCARCHVVPGTEPLPRVENCTVCHEWIRTVAASPRATERARELFPKWDRYARNTRSYLAVPSLSAAMARLEPTWVRGWLSDPHDIRPGMTEGMPTFALDGPTLDALEQAFADARVEVPATPAPDPANVELGRQLFETRGCIACHGFGATKPVPGIPTAPDLAHARARVSPDMAVAWIQNPMAISPEATMPPQPLTADEAVLVRDYLFLADPGGAEPAPLPPAPVATTEPVTWEQVEERVFGKICSHCHMKPDLNEGRAGPGNDGGFGYAATGVELQTREGVAAVADKLPELLLKRRVEARRDTVGHGEAPAALERPERPGMPMGLPPIPDEDIALVLGWIEQGMPE